MSAHTFEPELDQPTPRRIAAREGCAHGCGLWFVRLFCLPHTLAGPFLVYQAVRAIVLYLGVQYAGTDVEGAIVQKAEHSVKKGRYYTADYVFTVGGVEYTGHVQLNAETYAALREGQPIPVRVWESAPQAGHSWDGSEAGSLAGVKGLCFAALAWNAGLSVLVWFLYVRPWRQRQLVRYGQPTAGVVREVALSKNGKTPAYRIRYEYTPGPSEIFGGRRSGSVKVSPLKLAADVKVGDVMTVLYDPRRPRRNVLYRFGDYKAVGPSL
jgi:hypothetical protein